MSNIIEDVSILTTIPSKTINNLMDKFIYCIVDTVKEDNLEGKELTEVDLYVGKLCIQHVGKQLKYKFIPSDKLNKSMSNLFNNQLNSLECVLEKTLKNKIINTYKDLM